MNSLFKDLFFSITDLKRERQKKVFHLLVHFPDVQNFNAEARNQESGTSSGSSVWVDGPWAVFHCLPQAVRELD